MSTKYSVKRNRSLIIICTLLLIILILSILYFAERTKYTNENEKLENVSVYLYDLEVKNPLNVILNFLGQQPVESVNWDEEVFRKDLQSVFRDLDYGLSNMDYPEHQIVPKYILNQLHHLQEKIRPIFISISREEPLDEQTKEDIMNLSISVFSCEINGFSRGWAQIESNLKCLNETIAK